MLEQYSFLIQKIPVRSDESGASTNDEGDVDSHVIHQAQSYRKMSENYIANQKKLIGGHRYVSMD